jgi:hypothetical protein
MVRGKIFLTSIRLSSNLFLDFSDIKTTEIYAYLTSDNFRNAVVLLN